jgi:outer membrane autotransporter protein
MVGVAYNHFQDNSYKETGSINQNLKVSKKSSNKIEAILGARLSTNIKSNDMIFSPEAHVFVRQNLVGKAVKTYSSLDGMTGSFVVSAKPVKTSFNIGTSVNAQIDNINVALGYDAQIAAKYLAHQGTLKVRCNF